MSKDAENRTGPESTPATRTAGGAVLLWTAVVIWAALIFFFSAQPNLSTSLGFPDLILRKMAHLTEYGVFFLLLWRALRQHDLPQKGALTAGALLAMAYAASDEYHQSFVRGRTASPIDVSIDTVGILIAVLLALLLLRKKPDLLP